MSRHRDYLSTVDGLPPLWPSGPRWPTDDKMYEAVMGFCPPQVKGIARMLTGNYVRQRVMDGRWRMLAGLVEAARGQGVKTRGEWYELLVKGSGWKAAGGLRGDKEKQVSGDDFHIEAVEMMKGGLFELDDDFVDDPEKCKGACDECKTPCTSECMCGELFCSRACLKKSWKSHKKICETVFENAGIAMTLNQIEFSKLRPEVNFSSCLGRSDSDAPADVPTPNFVPGNSGGAVTERRKKTKPNEPCSCNSGKKYKKCCGDPAKFS